MKKFEIGDEVFTTLPGSAAFPGTVVDEREGWVRIAGTGTSGTKYDEWFSLNAPVVQIRRKRG